MRLNVGESKTFTLPFWLTAVDVVHEKCGLRLERKSGNAILYVNNGSRFNTYAGVALGSLKSLNEVGFTAKVHSDSKMLFNVGAVRFVIDFNAKKVATNLIGLRVGGSKAWGSNVQIPWRAEFQTLFGLPMPPMEMDKETGRLFWRWYDANEPDIYKMLTGDKKDVKSMYQQISLWLSPVFPYVKGSKFDFEIKCNCGNDTFIFHHGGDEQLMEDAAEFMAMMPENMAKRWNIIIEE